MKEKITRHLLDGAALRKEVAEKHSDTIERMARTIIESYHNGGALYIAGNGGSAADAQHIAGELVGRFRYDRDPLPATAFTTDTSVITAVANDYGFDDVFARQVEAHVKNGDVFLAISTSGNSPNVVRAAELARQKGASVLALCGRVGGELAALADTALVVPTQRTWDIQEIHITVGHIVCRLVEDAIFPRDEK